MQIFGLTIARTKALALPLPAVSNTRGGWWPIIREPFAGAWQQNQEQTVENVTAHVAVFACVSLIASDIGKTRFRLVEQDLDGIWSEVDSPAFSPVLRKPNGYQIRQQFYECWQTSKLLNGNTYVLKRRDQRNVVTGEYVLDPCRVRVLQAPDASVFYELQADAIAAIGESVIVPASEIIHDLYIALFHPLIGVSPIYACGRAAVQGLTIQGNSTTFFANGSQPSGVLTAPGVISQPTADRIKDKWETEFSGSNAGKVAVLGEGLKYEAMSIPAADSQLLDQLKFTSEMVCQAFRVPPHKICVGQQPNYNNIQALDLQYYAQCLQEKIEKVEELQDHGLGLGPTYGNAYGVEGDLDDLMRMDTATLIKSEKDAAGLKTVNESRKRLNLGPIEGGDTVYLQQQDTAIEAIARRDEAPTEPTAPAPVPDAMPPLPPAPVTKAITAADVQAQVFLHLAPVAVKHAEVDRAA